MNRVRTRLGAAMAAVAICASALAATGGVAHAVTNVPSPQLTVSSLIPSRPWPTGALTSVNANDVEGMVYVPANNSIWVADDNRDRIFEIDATTGGLKSQITGATFQTNATQHGTAKLCSDASLLDPSVPTDTGAFECLSRTDDFESIVYDPTGDVLYVTSGGCCAAGLPANYKDNPTVWKLTRSGSTFAPSEWQALPQGEDPTAAGWRPTGGTGTSGFYYGKDNFYRTYDFDTNTLGSTHSAPSYLVGIDFTDASHVFLTTSTPHPNQTGRTTAVSDSTVTEYTFDGTSFTAIPGWSFPLKGTGMIDARDLALVGDTFYVSDGYDFRTGTEFNGTATATDHPIYVYTLASAPTLTPAFTSVQQTSTSPFNVQFTDTTAPAATISSPPRTWAWDFDNNGTTDSTLQNPVHGYPATGVYNVKLTVTNAAGPFSVTKAVTVGGVVTPPGASWHYQPLNGSGSGVTTDRFGGGNALLQYGSTFHSFSQNTTKSSLAHSWWDGTKWNYENLDGAGVNTADNVGANVTAMTYFGQLQLFYSDATTHDLRHGWWNGTRWNFESLDGAGGTNGRTSDNVGGGVISVRQFGTQLQVFYSDDSAHSLRHGWWDGTRWNFETLDNGLPSSATYVSTTQYGNSFQVVYAGTGGQLRHAWWDAGWHKETLDGSASTYAGHTSNSVGAYATILQFNTQLDVVYQNTSSSSLRHAWWNGTRWNFETLDGSGGTIPGATAHNVGSHIATVLYGGGLHIFFQDTSNGALRHAWYAGGWHVEALDGTGAGYAGATGSSSTGFFTAVTLFAGQLQLTYIDHGTNDRLQHTWWG